MLEEEINYYIAGHNVQVLQTFKCFRLVFSSFSNQPCVHNRYSVVFSLWKMVGRPARGWSGLKIRYLCKLAWPYSFTASRMHSGLRKEGGGGSRRC